MKKIEKIATCKNKFYQYKDKQYYEIAERNKSMKGVKKQKRKKEQRRSWNRIIAKSENSKPWLWKKNSVYKKK